MTMKSPFAGSLAKNTGEVAHEAVDEIARKMETTVDEVKSGVSRAADTVKETADDLIEMERTAVAAARSAVRNHPLLAIGVLLAVGLLIGGFAAASRR
ncbi:MAG: hypothetical protein K2Y35_11840 [Burkholderiales bacterium]|nr:hypothetical protein [Burkholderiales bacterium]